MAWGETEGEKKLRTLPDSGSYGESLQVTRSRNEMDWTQLSINLQKRFETTDWAINWEFCTLLSSSSFQSRGIRAKFFV